MSSQVEILVHTTAPSRIADDAVYRQLAQSYLSFKPDTRIHIASSVSRVAKTSPPPPPISGPNQQYGTTSTPERVLCRDSQDLSFEEAFGNRSSPRLRRRSPKDKSIDRNPQKVDTNKDEWATPPSEIADSYPMPDLPFFRVTPTRVLQRYLNDNTSSSSVPYSSPSPTGGPRVSKRPEPPSAHIHSSIPLPEPATRPIKNAISKVKDTVPVTPAANSARSHPPIHETDPDLIDITHISSSDLSSRAESEPPPSKRPKSSHPDPNFIRSVSDTGPRSSIPFSLPSASSFKVDSSEIFAPSPPVTIDNLSPDCLISAKLAKLAIDLSSRYRPLDHRPIDPLERGYWSVNCTSWDTDTRAETWSFLHSYVKSGLAGWGVWCRRDAWGDNIRVYGWGHVAKHTYLLLYLASGRRVKATGANWHGADGDVTITVPPIEKVA